MLARTVKGKIEKKEKRNRTTQKRVALTTL